MPTTPDFEGLATFAKVSEEGSFAAAARALGVSVATVSRAVARLERRLGAPLVNRTSQKIGLTALGRDVAERATRLYKDAEETESAARESAVEPRGLLRVTVPMSFGLRWVAPLVPEFLSAHPDVSLDLHLSDAFVDLVSEGFDAAIRITALEDSSLVARRLAPVVAYLVASPAYLERHGRPKRPRDLATHACLAYAYRPTWRFRSDRSEEESVTPDARLRVTNADALVPSVLAGLGITDLPEFLACDHLHAGRLELVLPRWSFPPGTLSFVTPSRARPRKVEAFADFLAARLAGPPWRPGRRRTGR